MISADGHVGPPTKQFRSYMERMFLADFDDYLATHKHRLTLLSDDRGVWGEQIKLQWQGEAKVKAGGLDGLWDAQRRIKEAEEDGIVAEILFPDEQTFNTPPFTIGIASPGLSGDDRDFTPQQKLAGARAYNRWLVDFCSASPDRLLGLVLIGSLEDIPGAVAEIRRAHDDGLHAGIMLPLHYTGLPFYNHPRYEPIWATCAELKMPVHSHAGTGEPDHRGEPASSLPAQAVESFWFAHRPLWYMIFGGVLERHPDLKLIFTEQGSKWVIETLRMMDYLIDISAFGTDAYPASLKPSEYFQRQCWIGASLIDTTEVSLRHEIGVAKLMWGSDYPHFEGTWPHTAEHNREVFAGVPSDDLESIMGLNALTAYGLDGAALGIVAQRVGPRLCDVATA
jgi:predicted TIM-barrel fold metal-dependent hydrolase